MVHCACSRRTGSTRRYYGTLCMSAEDRHYEEVLLYTVHVGGGPAALGGAEVVKPESKERTNERTNYFQHHPFCRPKVSAVGSLGKVHAEAPACLVTHHTPKQRASGPRPSNSHLPPPPGSYEANTTVEKVEVF